MTSKNKDEHQVAPSRLEYNILKQLVRTRTDIELWPRGWTFPMLYVTNYNELQ